MSFESLGLPAALARAVADSGYQNTIVMHRVIHYTTVRQRRIFIHTRLRGSKTHVEDPSSKVDGDLHASVDIGQAPHTHSTGARLADGGREHSDREQQRTAGHSGRNSPAMRANDSGYVAAMPHIIVRIVVPTAAITH